MNIDVTKLTASELRELKKQVEKEIKDRDDLTSKGQVPVSEDLWKIFHVQFTRDGFGTWSSVNAASRFYDCIYKLADYTFGNYKVVKSKMQNGEMAPKINGTLIELNDKANAYKAMCLDIVNIVKKYSIKAKPTNNYLVWATDKYVETHTHTEWDKAAEYVMACINTMGDEYSTDAYLKEHPEAKDFIKEELKNE